MANLYFRGKSIIQNHHLSVKYHELIPKKSRSLTKNISLNDNLIIHGDNLKGLKALLPLYAGKVKCIYIDPPYNTGNEKWIYNDNVNSPMIKEWLGKVVDKDDLIRHDKWLCMMMPRLKLLRDFLRENGVIFVSVDNNEAHNLKLLLDEVFQMNFVTEFVWHKKYGGGGDNKNNVTEHEYVLCYSQLNPDINQVLNGVEYDYDDFADYEKDEENRYYSANESILMRGPNSTPDKRPNLCYKIKDPDGNMILPRDGMGTWCYDKTTLKAKLENHELEWKKVKGKWMLYKKQFLYVSDELREKKPRTILDRRYSIGQTGEGTVILENIFGKKRIFPNPKPVSLIKFLISLSTEANSEEIILDSFAGSATTAHSVLELNQEDGGNRRFILVECEDYADKITAERVRRVIKGVPKAKYESLKKGLGGSFSYFELGDPIEMESILEGDKLPDYTELARYIFYTATGEEFDLFKIDENKSFIGESREYKIYLFYKPDIDYLKSTAFTLDLAKSLGPFKGKKRLVFAPSKYLDLNDTELIEKHGIKGIEYCQLPFEIYKLKE